ncbi:MAG: hypothetical protein R2710_11610 [Acidimicrobiales bacterium]
MVEADRFHREHAVAELAIRDLKEDAELEHIPSEHFHANAAWLGCSVLGHNIGIWASMISGQPAVTCRASTTARYANACIDALRPPVQPVLTPTSRPRPPRKPFRSRSVDGG